MIVTLYLMHYSDSEPVLLHYCDSHCFIVGMMTDRSRQKQKMTDRSSADGIFTLSVRTGAMGNKHAGVGP